jgi:hypothetical protein
MKRARIFYTGDIVKDFLFSLLGLLGASLFMGLALLKAYEEFKRGVKENSRVRIWSAFVGVSFVFTLIVHMIVRMQ